MSFGQIQRQQLKTIKKLVTELWQVRESISQLLKSDHRASGLTEEDLRRELNKRRRPLMALVDNDVLPRIDRNFMDARIDIFLSVHLQLKQ